MAGNIVLTGFVTFVFLFAVIIFDINKLLPKAAQLVLAIIFILSLVAMAAGSVYGIWFGWT